MSKSFSPSPQVTATALPDPEPQIISTIKPIARPKQRIDSDAKIKIPSVPTELRTEIPSFNNKGLIFFNPPQPPNSKNSNVSLHRCFLT